MELTPVRAFRRIGGAALILAPLVMLVADATAAALGERAFWAWSVGLWISLYLFIGAILAVVDVLSARALRLGLLFGGTALLGLLTAATMQGIFRARYVLYGMAETPELMTSEILASSIAPGILFPLSILALAILLGRTGGLGWGLALALAAGAVLFPVGRFIVGDVRINVVSDLLMAAALVSLGVRVWRAAPAPVGR